MKTLAIELIRIAKETSAKTLDLGRCGLTESNIPQELFTLFELEELILSNEYFDSSLSKWVPSKNTGNENYFSVLPTELSKLRSLKKLSVGGTFAKRWEIRDLSVLATMPSLTSLFCDSNQITDLSPLSSLPLLTELSCSTNPIKDLIPLSSLTNLRQLYCTGIGLSNLSPLKNLTQLVSLYCFNNQISNLSPLEVLENLTDLNVKKNQITDLSSLAKLKNLQQLNCSENPLFDLTPLAKLSRLERLTCFKCHISDLRMLANLQSLTKIDCQSNSIAELTPLSSLQNLRKLYCGYNKLTDLSPISGLTELRRLFCYNNKIASLAPLANLTKLEVLYGSDNEYIDLSPLIHLNALSELDCSRNQIQDLSPISGLKELRILKFARNEIWDISPVTNLLELKELNCSRNKIESLMPIQNLYALEKLDCRHNQLSDLKPLVNLISLKEVSCTDNPLRTPPMGVAQEGILSIRSYFKSIDNSNLINANLILNTELKLIVLGNSTSGKSSFIEWLQTGKISPKRDTTHGMVTARWKPTFTIGGQKKVNVKILDFGGQEFYHDAHHLFLSNNALYVILWDKRQNKHSITKTKLFIHGIEQEVDLEHFPIDYWLWCVNQYGKPELDKKRNKLNVHALLVQNRIDETDNEREWLDQSFYKQKYPFIYDFIATSLLKNQGTSILKEFIKEFCQQSTIIGEEIPEFWLTIRDRLIDQEERKITYLQFKQICQSINPSINEEAIYFLCLFLHNTFNLQYFKDGPVPRDDEWVITDPTWLTEQIYKVLNVDLATKSGRFTKEYVRAVLSEDKSDADCQTLLDLLLRFQLVVKVNDELETFIAPQYLPDYPSVETRFFLVNFKPFFRFNFKGFLHRKVIFEIFKTFSSDTSDNSIIWKYGLIIQKEGEQLLIKIQRDLNSIELSTGDNVALNSEFFQSIIEKIRVINCLYEVKECVSVDRRTFIELSTIERTVNARLSEFSFNNKYYRVAQFREFLVYVPSVNTRYLNLKVFISYSRHDKQLRDELETHLSSLRREGLIDLWHDGMLEPGREWDIQIKNQLQQADLVLLLLSPDFINTDYTWEIELQESLNRHTDGTARVVPILLRACYFEGLPSISSLAIIPAKAKPIDSPNRAERDVAWKGVIQSLKEVIETWALTNS
ncbi:leucine-rich repeat domain-containing protein [Larkinella bovis]|uniref:Leucine-rich repeat domain-containing protein n=1 Tax=Larkinella bovis TaxID=683041 RepID=A0ABW0IBQ9_9BACT